MFEDQCRVREARSFTVSALHQLINVHFGYNCTIGRIKSGEKSDAD